MSGGKNYLDDLPMEVLCDDLFDHIDDLLDFPSYDDFMLAGDTIENPFNTQCVVAPPPPLAPLQPSPPLCDDIANAATVGSNNDDNKLVGNLNKYVSTEDELEAAAELEWVSNFMDDTTDTFSLEFMPIDTTTIIKHDQLFRTPSPVSVLDPNCTLTASGGAASSATSSSSSSSSYTSSSAGGGGSFNNKTNPISQLVPARAARSKRPRPAAFSLARPIIAVPPQPESFGESTTPQSAEMKKKRIKIKKYVVPPSARIVDTAASSGGDVAAAAAVAPPGVRKCMHCEITKTPQWRAGPMGPKTLCNACGVRYKSGRLFPEYRPAASPTFVPTIHSNSHKKVVEMRISSTYKPMPGMPSPESCDLLEYIRRRE